MKPLINDGSGRCVRCVHPPGHLPFQLFVGDCTRFSNDLPGSQIPRPVTLPCLIRLNQLCLRLLTCSSETGSFVCIWRRTRL